MLAWFAWEWIVAAGRNFEIGYFQISSNENLGLDSGGFQIPIRLKVCSQQKQSLECFTTRGWCGWVGDVHHKSETTTKYDLIEA
jgi:hypothetical protein